MTADAKTDLWLVVAFVGLVLLLALCGCQDVPVVWSPSVA